MTDSGHGVFCLICSMELVGVTWTRDYWAGTIKSRIAQYQGCMVYVPRTKIKVVTPKVEENRFVRDAIDRGNMQVASIAKIIIAQYVVEPEEIRNAAISTYAHSRRLVSELNNLKTEIEDLEVKLNVLKKYREVKHYGEKLSAMNTEFNQADKKARELADAQRTIEEYLRQEQSRGEPKRKRNDLE